MRTVHGCAAALAAAIAVVGCARQQTQTSTAAMGDVAPATGEWVAVFAPESQYSSASGIKGNAHVKASAVQGQSDIEVELQGADPRASYPWEIVSGTCGQFDPAAAPVTRLAPLTVDESGKGHGAAALDPSRLGNAPYAIVIFSPLTHGEPIACGDLKAGS